MPSVLVIDDEKATLTMFRLFLKAFGYDVLVAEDGDTGLALFGAEKPPLVFTDLKMPGIDGFDVLRAIKAASPETEVIVITGHGDMDLVLRALNLDATDFINKPVSRTALQTALDRAEHRIRHPEARRCRVTATPTTVDHPAVVFIEGVLNASGKETLRRIAQADDVAGCPGVVFEFAPHASFNGAGLDLFIRLLADLKERGLPVAISGLCENFRIIMEMIGVPKTLPFAATMAEACAAIAAETPEH
ncbi:MAG: response regulator [Pseudomonadota bacterium]